jgi:hypothetical protein
MESFGTSEANIRILLPERVRKLCEYNIFSEVINTFKPTNKIVNKIIEK